MLNTKTHTGKRTQGLVSVDQERSPSTIPRHGSTSPATPRYTKKSECFSVIHIECRRLATIFNICIARAETISFVLMMLDITPFRISLNSVLNESGIHDEVLDTTYQVTLPRHC